MTGGLGDLPAREDRAIRTPLSSSVRNDLKNGSLPLGNKPIADPQFGKDMLGLRWVVFDLPAQSHYIDADEMAVVGMRGSPNITCVRLVQD